MTQPLKLVITDTEEGRLEYSTAKRRLRVGRAQGLDISRPNDSLISNRHCIITDGVLLDKGSTNGTFLNGELVPIETETALKPGDTLAVGNTVIQVQEADESTPNDAPTEDINTPAGDMFLVLKGIKYFLPEQTISIGRQPSNTISLDDKLVSGNHCAIINGELLDERSTNGTFVNGQQVPYCLEQKLSVGDRVRVGEVTMTVVAATDEEVARWHVDGATNDNAAALAETTNAQTLAGQLSPGARVVAFADESQMDGTVTGDEALQEPGPNDTAQLSTGEAVSSFSADKDKLGSVSEAPKLKNKSSKRGGFASLATAALLVGVAGAGFFLYKHLNDKKALPPPTKN